MKKITNDFVLTVATVNGSGSQSSNLVLVKTLFRMGVPVGGKNLFPSNIAGLPTWFTIRANPNGFVGRKFPNDLVVAMNRDTIDKDVQSLREGGVFIYNSDLKFDDVLLRKDVTNIGVPFREVVAGVTDSVKLRKYLTNMVYVGVLAKLLKVDLQTIHEVLSDQFGDKPHVIETNEAAVKAGYAYASENLEIDIPVEVQRIIDGNRGKILVDGNSATAAGLVNGGCGFMAWYPITPSSSVAENFEAFCNKYRLDADRKNKFAIVQAEDELAAMSMVIGAGWTGTRAITPTSGPGMSLMSEAVGLSYFAEIPTVLWNVQRVGPSTGLPTRTMQGDLFAAYNLSHGDCKHVVLLPANPGECFSFGQDCFDLAERLQTPVIVLSDLDLGMNFWVCDEFKPTDKKYDRGKVLNAEDLERVQDFGRYADVDGDGIPYRTLPGTHHPNAAYFCRGTGHDEQSKYTESPEVFKTLMDRLTRKFELARTLVPKPVVDNNNKANLGIIAYGSSNQAIGEVRANLTEAGTETSYLRVRALPLSDEVRNFIEAHDEIVIVEQNRDAQMTSILNSEWPEYHKKIRPILEYDGLPLSAKFVTSEILQKEAH